MMRFAMSNSNISLIAYYVPVAIAVPAGRLNLPCFNAGVRSSAQRAALRTEAIIRARPCVSPSSLRLQTHERSLRLIAKRFIAIRPSVD